MTTGETTEAAASNGEFDPKAASRAAWALGDYHTFAKQTVWEIGEVLVRACGIARGHRVLDIAAGTGNTAIRAAEAGAVVVASDLTPENFTAGRREAEAHGVRLEWVQADAEALPFTDDEFDVATSSFGAIFAPPGGGRRAAAGLPARRHDRNGQLHARGLNLRLLRRARALHVPTPAGRAAASNVGQRATRAQTVRRPAGIAGDDPRRLHGESGQPARLPRVSSRRSGPSSRPTRASPTSASGRRRSTRISSSSLSAPTADRQTVPRSTATSTCSSSLESAARSPPCERRHPDGEVMTGRRARPSERAARDSEPIVLQRVKTPNSKISQVDLVVSFIARSLPFNRALLRRLGWSGRREAPGEQGKTAYYRSVEAWAWPPWTYARKVGYADPTYFVRSFRRNQGTHRFAGAVPAR